MWGGELQFLKSHKNIVFQGSALSLVKNYQKATTASNRKKHILEAAEILNVIITRRQVSANTESVYHVINH